MILIPTVNDTNNVSNKTFVAVKQEYHLFHVVLFIINNSIIYYS